MFQTCPVKMSRIAPGFDAQLTAGEERHHRQHDAGKKTEYRDRLQDVEQRNHEALGPRIVGGDVTVDQRECQAEQVGDRDAQQRISGVGRQGPEAARDFDLWREGPEPGAADDQHAIEQARCRLRT